MDKRANPDIQTTNISREIENYIQSFIQLYTSAALGDEDVEAAMVVGEKTFSANDGHEAIVVKYSDASGNPLRYELHYYGETGDRTVNYYLCEGFCWVSDQTNYYSSWVFDPEYQNVLYSEVENWILMDETAYIMYASKELEEVDWERLDIPLPEEVERYWKEGLKRR